MVKNDFWLTSGWHLFDQNDEGHLVPTEDFMRAYFYRPEVVPIEESCEAETNLHKKLVDKPFALVEKKELNSIKDKDVIFNYEVILKFRDFLCFQYRKQMETNLSQKVADFFVCNFCDYKTSKKSEKRKERKMFDMCFLGASWGAPGGPPAGSLGPPRGP